jgi:hypothetical protein
LNFTQKQIELFDLRLTELDLTDGLEIPGEENRAAGRTVTSPPLGLTGEAHLLVPKFDSESDSDEDSDEEQEQQGLQGEMITSNKFTRHSSGGYELVGGRGDGGDSEIASSEGGSYFPSTTSINQGFMKSKASLAQVPALPPLLFD